MSGILSGVDYSLLFSGSASIAGSGSASTNILNALYNTGAGSVGGGSSGNPVQALTQAENNQTADVAAEAATPSVAQAISAFKSAVASATSISSALENPAILQVLLTANNLADQIPYPALAQQALMSNPNDSNSLANQLSSTNSNWLSTVQAYNFYQNGLSALQNSQNQANLISAYTQITWLNSLDATTPGLSSAITFKQNASSITSADDILGNPVYRDVVTTALNIPEQIAEQDLGAQENAITSALNISQLQNPNYVNTITDQYLLNKQQAAASSGTSATPSLDDLAVQAMGLIA
jgi:Protein of unknown function (DUF1217)